MIERHWEGIATYCQPENKVALGFVEDLNHKIRVIQRRAYGLRDEEYLRLKILTTMLPDLPLTKFVENDPHESPKSLFFCGPGVSGSHPGEPRCGAPRDATP